MQQLGRFVAILIIAACMVAVANIIGGKHTFVESLYGALVLAGLVIAGKILAMLPGLSRFPLVFWVSFVGIVVSIPGVPGQSWFLSVTKVVDFLPMTAPVLAYAGLSLGKDIPAFRRLSWRIIPVALAVTTGTFLLAVAIAQVVLHLEGVI